MLNQLFHPAVAAWFQERFEAPSPAQLEAWPAIQQRQNVLIAAPTGSGKTLAAFLTAIDSLVRQSLRGGALYKGSGGLPNLTTVLYISPLKALSNDIQKNLQEPLYGISEKLMQQGLPAFEIRAAVRTGDTPQSERTKMRNKPPHILVTTPESLFILLTSESGRQMLSAINTVIVDEIHALAGNKRGTHLALSLERLCALTPTPPVRIGLSATQKPLDEIARFLVGNTNNKNRLGKKKMDDLFIQVATRELNKNTVCPRLDSFSVRGELVEPTTNGTDFAEENKTNKVNEKFDSTTVRPESFDLAQESPVEGLSDSKHVLRQLSSVRGEPSRTKDERQTQHKLPCTIIDTGHVRKRDLAIEVPQSPLEAVMSNEIWQEIYDRLENLINTHQTTLIFVNTRRLAERAARFLAERVGEENVTSHHGSLSKEHRLNAEQRLKAGKLKALVATASLELGIDIGDIDLVVQIGSPRSIAAFLQRVGRSGHRLGAVPKGRLFPLSRDDLLECAALLHAIADDELDHIQVPSGHLDVLAQQIIAEVACEDWQEDQLFELITGAYPFRDLTREQFNDIVTMLVEGFSSRRGRHSRYLHHDAVNKLLKARKGAKLTAVTNGGVIPDMFDYDVVLEPDNQSIGSLNEDFAFESLPGDIFQLGNTSYQIIKVEQGKVRVVDAHGQPPNIPFWFGEAPGRSDVLSVYVSQLRENIELQLKQGKDIEEWLTRALALPPAAAVQLADYLKSTHAALGTLPTQNNIVFERFFDEVGDQHLVVHSPYGSRINRAWGLGLRKSFCRQFNFELQAAALDDSIVLSLGSTHSFPLEDVKHFVKANSVRDKVTQAMLQAPMFGTHWRWNATTALALKRSNAGKRIPAQFQRMNAEDLMALVFPDQLACQDNIVGEREVPNHPLVNQTVEDCLNDVMDIDGLIEVLKKIETGEINIQCADLAGPSPMSHAIINARPYAFLDDAPAEERRTLAITTRRFANPESAADLATLDPKAIDQVRMEAWPIARDEDEAHDALMMLGVMTDAESRGNNPAKCFYAEFLQNLAHQKRVTKLTIATQTLWVCAERLAQVQAVFNDCQLNPNIDAVGYLAQKQWDKQTALTELLRARLECVGPVTEQQLQNVFECSHSELKQALTALEVDGFAMQGNFSGQRKVDSAQLKESETQDTRHSRAGGNLFMEVHESQSSIEWCERGLLARINRYTIKSLRDEIKPVSAADYMQFLFLWHGMGDIKADGDDALLETINRLEGFPVPAAAWEKDILPVRLKNYFPSALDRLCSQGRITWKRHVKNTNNNEEKSNKAGLLRNTPVVLINRLHSIYWRQSSSADDNIKLSSGAQKVFDALKQQGASFFNDIVYAAGMLQVSVEEALAELAAHGLITSDNFSGLRALITPSNKRPNFVGSQSSSKQRRHRSVTLPGGIDDAGRWALIPSINMIQPENAPTGWLSTDEDTLNHIAFVLLKRYGVVFRKVLERESKLPPWRELLYAYRRMEARGEIRGGRFVDGFGGEQFALPEAVGLLRKQRGSPDKGGNEENSELTQQVVISACDPLNLIGIVLPGERVPAQSGNRIIFRGGKVIAVQVGKDVKFLVNVEEGEKWGIQNQLIKQSNPAGYFGAR